MNNLQLVQRNPETLPIYQPPHVIVVRVPETLPSDQAADHFINGFAAGIFAALAFIVFILATWLF